MKTSSLLAFGPPDSLGVDPDAKNLLLRIISDGHYLHSCLDYGGTLQATCLVAKENELCLNLICKIYLNYPVRTSTRRNSLHEQIVDVKKVSNGCLNDLVPQISSIYYVPSEGYKAFVRKIYYDLHIRRLLIEVFPETQSKCFLFISRLQRAIVGLGLENELSLGITSYENTVMQGFTPEILEKAKEMDLKLAPMKILGSPKSDQDVEVAIRKLIGFHESNQLFRGITKVSSLVHYEGLASIIQKQLLASASISQLDSKTGRVRHGNRIVAINPYGLGRKSSNLDRVKGFARDAIDIIRLIAFGWSQKSFLPIKKIWPTNLI